MRRHQVKSRGGAWFFLPLFWVPFAPLPHIGSFVPPDLRFWVHLHPFHYGVFFAPPIESFLAPRFLGPFCTRSTYRRVFFVPVLGPLCTCSTHRVSFCPRSTYRVCFCPRFGSPVPRVGFLSYLFSHSESLLLYTYGFCLHPFQIQVALKQARKAFKKQGLGGGGWGGRPPICKHNAPVAG